MKYLERFGDWAKDNPKLLIIDIVSLLLAVILIWLVLTRGISGVPDNSISEQPSQPPIVVSQLPAPIPAVDPDENSSNTKAYSIGSLIGNIYNDSKDAVINFWHGFDSSTDFTQWVKSKWDSGRQWINDWLGRDS